MMQFVAIRHSYINDNQLWKEQFIWVVLVEVIETKYALYVFADKLFEIAHKLLILAQKLFNLLEHIFQWLKSIFWSKKIYSKSIGSY